jgi:hypothetical protein
MVVYKETANTNVVLRDFSIARQNTAACVSLSIPTMSMTGRLHPPGPKLLCHQSGDETARARQPYLVIEESGAYTA